MPAETRIDLAGHPVPVVAGGLYDRFRSNPPRSVIAAEYPAIDPRWFRKLAKEKVAIGFETCKPVTRPTIRIPTQPLP